MVCIKCEILHKMFVVVGGGGGCPFWGGRGGRSVVGVCFWIRFCVDFYLCDCVCVRNLNRFM